MYSMLSLLVPLKVVESCEFLLALTYRANMARSAIAGPMAFQVLPHVSSLSHLERTDSADNWLHVSLEVLSVGS